ncbi:MAG: ATP-binding protein, partial [Desulfovibrionales bacterium]|nr:ATP-binding protein [Desulfovibrionales bacterium]
MEYKNVSAFINRHAEIEYLNKWISEESKNILFFYGPKSSGK